MSSAGITRIALAGDVMIGRGVDQIMRRPGDPTLYEGWARSALRYVELAEARSGPLPRRVDPAYVWGATLERLETLDVDLRIVNLETAVTARGSPESGKGVHYRVHPDNSDCLVAGKIDAVTLANNHILDWSEVGLYDTIDTLERLGVQYTGAGKNHAIAWETTTVGARSVRVVVLGLGAPSSGIHLDWGARDDRPGVALVSRLSSANVEEVARALRRATHSAGVTVVSIHWGSNWGYRVPSLHQEFARALVDEAGVDVVHGHSSHHPLGFEVYRDRLILYGCGDLITDYEGIGGHEEFRPELGSWYVADVDSGTGALRRLTLVPTKMHRFRLTDQTRDEMKWFSARLEQESLTPGVGIRVGSDLLEVEW